MPPLKDRLYRFLRWSEKYTKTDMVYLASGGFWSTLAQVVTSFTVFGFAILVAHYLPKEVYGEYKYVIATVALLSSFSLTGLGTAVFQSVANGFDGTLREGFWKNLRWSALVFLGALALAIYYFSQENQTLAFGFLIGGSLSPLLTSANLSSTFLQAKKDFRRAAIYIGIIETLVSVGVLIITIFITHSVLALVAAYFLGNTLSTLWIYRRVERTYAPDPAKADPGMMRYAKHLSFMGVLSNISGHIDQVLLFHFVGPVQLAIYNFAVAIPDQAKGPLKTLDTMTQARFATREAADIHTSIRNKIFWIFFTSTAGVFVYILIAPFFYNFFFPNYVASVQYSQIYALSLLAAVASPAASYLSVKKKVRYLYVNTVTSSLVRIALLVIGVVYWGLLGLVTARVIIRLSGAALTTGLYYHAVHIDSAKN